MPWIYVRPRDDESVAFRRAALERTAAWWSAFSGRFVEIEAALGGASAWDARGWVAQEVRAIDPRLSTRMDVGPDGLRLVISPGANRHLRPMIRSIIVAAPQLPGWSFHEYRQPESMDRATELVRVRTGHAMNVLTVRPSLAVGVPRRVDLLYSVKLAGDDESAARDIALAATDYLLGEEAVEKWIADIDVTIPTRSIGEAAFLHPARLVTTVETLARSIRDQRPAVPYHKLREEMAPTKFKMSPHHAQDYVRQDDLAYGRTVLPEFRRLVDPPYRHTFHSGAFSRLGEVFCYLKVDSQQMSMDQRLVVRRDYEHQIRRPLAEADAAAVLGGGTGLRYMYFDLAVVNLPRTVDILRNALLPIGLPERAWLQFYDTDLADEYVALQPTAPPPPGIGTAEVAATSKPSAAKPVEAMRPPPPSSPSSAVEGVTAEAAVPLWDPDSSDPLPM